MKGQLNVMRLSAARQMSDAVGSVGDHCRKFLCQVNHLLDLVNGRDNLGKVLFLIYFSHLCYQIGGNAMPKFLDSVNTCSFKKLRKLRTDALHTEEVCMVYPSEDEAAIDSGGLLNFGFHLVLFLEYFVLVGLCNVNLFLMLPLSPPFVECHRVILKRNLCENVR